MGVDPAYEKVVLVTRRTRLEGLIARFNTRSQAEFYINHSGGDFAMYEQEHETYYAALAELRGELRRLANVQTIERSFLPNFLFSREELVVAIGIDGIVVNTAKYLRGQPLVAVNPDPAHIDGILLPFNVAEAISVVRRALSGKVNVRSITMAEALLNDGQTLLAFNDLFIGRNDQISARYTIRANGRSERHSSSGIIISTGAGATGWLSSLFNMANGLAIGFGEDSKHLKRPHLDWEADQLIFVVREPFISKASDAGIVCGTITARTPLELESNMPEGGVIFSDGVPADHLAFNAGAVARIGLSARKTNLVVG